MRQFKMTTIIGREEELSILKKLFKSNKAEFLAIYGRRRVGKTYLIRQFSNNQEAAFFNVTGSKEGTKKEQLTHFVEQIGKVFYGGVALSVPLQWDGAFNLLTTAMEQHAKNKKIILFFDEIPWMATPKSRLLQNLDYYWNQHWSNDQRIKLIICGSSASWIIKKVINNRGGLHNRLTQRIRLEPFTLLETKHFLENIGITLSHSHILLLYMVMGGIPYYLAHLEKGLSVIQNIEKLAFMENGLLFNEFDHLFASLFDHAEEYSEMIQLIGSKQYGIGQRELLKGLKKSMLGSGGYKKLKELEDTGFILSFMPYQHQRQGIYYRLIDEYSLFYLKWIAPIRKTLQRKAMQHGNFERMQQTSEWNSWLGYAFESACYQHMPLIRKKLAISPGAIADSWRYVPRKNAAERGAQIDLLFDRTDDAITLCEIKYSTTPFLLTKEYVEILQRKMLVFKEKTGTKKQLFLALIAAGGLKNNFYAEDIVSSVVELDDFFMKE